MNQQEEESGEKVDITKDFKDACKLALFPGELLHGSWFSLQYAIFAIEIMDSKLDARCQNRRKVPTLRDVIDKKMLQFSTFADKSILIGIIDEFLCVYVNWINGDLLSQTVFSSMYMHCTQLIEDNYLVLFCESMRKLVYFTRQVIMSASVYEEEDFYASLNGMTLDGPDKRFDNFNDKAEKFDETYRPKSKVIEYSLLIEKLEDACIELNQGSEDWHYNLSIRLRYICNSLKISYTFAQLCQDKNISSMLSKLNFEDDETTEETIDLLSILEGCDSITNNLIASTHELLVTADFGKTAGKGKEDPLNFEYGIPGFELLLNSSKQPASIPKIVRIINRKEGFIYLTELSQRLRNIVMIFINFFKNTVEENRELSKTTFYIIMQKLSQIEGRKMKQIMEDADKSPRLQLAGGCIISRSFCKILCSILLNEDYKIKSTQKMEKLLRIWSKIDPFIDEKYLDQVLEKQFVPEVLSHCDKLLDTMININCYNTSRQYTAIKNLLNEYMKNSSLWKQPENYIMCLYEEDKLTQDILADQQPHFSFIMIYFFYHLVWNFLVQGFYLELYCCSELPIVFSFLIGHIKNLEKFIENYLMEISTSYLRFQKLRAKIENSRIMEKKYINVFSRFQKELIYLRANCFLLSGSLMSHMAILKDSFLNLFAEPIEKPAQDDKKLKLIIPKDNFPEIFSRRFGILFSNPLLFPKEYCGRTKAYEYINERNEEIMNSMNSKELYTESAKIFNAAKETFEIYKSQINSDETSSIERETMLHIFPHPSQADPIEDLITVSKRNSIACSLLSNCPDKRPAKTLEKPATFHFPYKNSPVTYDFSALNSKSTPVIILNPKKTP